MRLLPFVPEVIKKCKVVNEEIRFVHLDGIMRTAKFFELSKICKKPRGKEKFVTVVIRQFEIGPPHFYSIRNRRR